MLPTRDPRVCSLSELLTPRKVAERIVPSARHNAAPKRDHPRIQVVQR